MMDIDPNENEISNIQIGLDVSSSNNDSSVDNSLVSSSKKIKLSKDEMEKFKAERARLKQERKALKMQREMARLEKEKQKIAREKQLLEERERKDRLKEEEREKKERIRREKEEERIREKKAKDEERQRKLEEKQALAEEAKKKEELKAKLEQDKLDKSRAVLFKFLKKSPQKHLPGTGACTESEERIPVAGIVPESLLNAFVPENFDNCIKNQTELVENLYLNSLLTGKIVPWRKENQPNDGTNEPVTESSPEIIEQSSAPVHYIYLKFTENVKPPYMGPKPNGPTMLSGRNPFAKLESLDYDLDSDEEWEEGGPGESLSDSDSEPEQEKDDYEIDNEFFVPHGYLSDDEDLDRPPPVTGDANGGSPTAKPGPLLKEQTLLAERSHRFSEKLIPQVIGCIWATKISGQDSAVGGEKYEFLERFKIVPMPK